MDKSLVSLLHLAQQESFSDFFKSSAEGTVGKFSPFSARLPPFKAEDQTICLSGCLKRSQLKVQTKHPMLPSAKHSLVTLLLRQAPTDNCQEGIQYVGSVLQQLYWSLGPKNALWSINHQCVQCRRGSVQLLEPQMVDIPKERSNGIIYIFQNTGTE